MADHGTPNKSLNASFSHMNVFNSNFYGGGMGGLNNSRLNLSNFLFDQRNSNIFGINALSLAAAAAASTGNL